MFNVVYIWLGVLAGDETQTGDIDYNVRTVDAKVLNPNGPNFRLEWRCRPQQKQETGRRLQIRSRPRKNQLATAVRRRWMCHTRTVLPAGAAAGRYFFNAVLSACWLCSWLYS